MSDPKPKASRITFIVALVTLAGVLVWGGTVNAARYDALFNAYVTATDQLNDAGIEPDAPDPDVIASDPSPGEPGQDGRDGLDGRTPTRSELLGLIAAYCAANGECRGPAGLNGVDGVGTPGTNGTDGAPGAPGAAGTNGMNGEPPHSWTQPGILPNSTVTCTRTDPFDPAAPQYVCTTNPPTEPETP